MAVLRRQRSTVKDYPPLVLAGLVMLLLLAVMPSALNLPQTNPSETLEYAPVPPEDDQVNPPVGNLSSLGLGQSSSIGSEPADGELETPGGAASGAGVGKNPSTKQCSGSPPRQTADPLAPPCVAFYEGDNGGATYHGVTGDEIRILFYVQGLFTDCVTQYGCEQRPASTYHDLWEPPEPENDEEEHVYLRQLRIWQRHFNERYQTYGRRAHFFVYYNNGTSGVEQRRSDAVENLERVKPFAVQTYAPNPDPYIEVMARRGIMNFGSIANKPASFFSQFPKLIWGYLPSIEQQADMYSSWVCTQIVNRPVSFSGNPEDQGEPRKFGFISSADPSHPGLQLFAREARARIERCGGDIVAEGTHPYHGYATDTRSAGDYAVQNIARFMQAGVTTILWAQGYETNHSTAAAQADWQPEWVIAGDGSQDGWQNGQRQDQSVWNHAWVMTNVVRSGDVRESYCYQAQAEDPSHNDTDAAWDCNLHTFYQDLRQVFTGIQVAGPRLTPSTIDKGFRAIPAIQSDNPFVPACFYRPGDYTCVKDAMVNWWDSESQPPARNEPGCWRMVEEGRRYFAGTWPEREAAAGRDASEDPCNGYPGPLLLYVGTA